MITLHDTTIVEQGCSDSAKNIFYAILDDGRRVVFNQPRKHDSRKQRVAWGEISEFNKMRYRRVNVDKRLYNINYRCKMPLYQGEFPGILPLSVKVDGEVVGFCDIFFRLGASFKKFLVDPVDKCANGSIIALDKFHGMGVGHIYGSMSTLIARHYGCDYILGTTFMKGGMRRIREKAGCEIISTDGNQVRFKKRL